MNHYLITEMWAVIQWSATSSLKGENTLKLNQNLVQQGIFHTEPFNA